MERERRIKGETTVEVSYYITSLDRDRACAGRLGELIRAHWGIENRLHYVRDVTWGEDASRVRKGSSPEVLAALRSTTNYLLEGVKAPSKAATRRSPTRGTTSHPYLSSISEWPCASNLASRTTGCYSPNTRKCGRTARFRGFWWRASHVRSHKFSRIAHST